MPKNNSTDLIIYQIGPQSTKFFKPTPIIHNLHGVSQDFDNKAGKVYQLKKLINQHQFSESLEMLEKSGISGDFALFIIQNIQILEVA